MSARDHTPGSTLNASRRGTKSRLRAVALPTEHGGWGFLLEPILLGLLVAPSWGAVALAVAATATFLARQPLKVVLTDQRRGLETVRTGLARQVAWGYALAAAAGGALALMLAGPRFLLPLGLAIPFGLIFIYFDLTKPGRTLQAELAAPVALGAVAAAMGMMDGWALLPAVALWTLLTLRAVPSILYVRARLRLDRGRDAAVGGALAAHSVALVAAGGLAWLGLLPWSAAVAMTVLLLRAAVMLASFRPMVAVKTIGFMELGLGILVVVLVAWGIG